MLIQLLFTEPSLFLVIVLAILLALSIHEYFHAWMAFYLGDPTAKLQGRLTINPLAHLDPIGTLLFIFIGFGWGKPVPFNPLNLKNQKTGELLVGLAGPFSNFLAALIAGLFLRFFEPINPGFSFFLSFFVWINIALGIFNLMPIPPLDGSHILFAFISSEEIKLQLIRNSSLFFIILIFLMIFIGFSFIVRPLYILIVGGPPLF